MAVRMKHRRHRLWIIAATVCALIVVPMARPASADPEDDGHSIEEELEIAIEEFVEAEQELDVALETSGATPRDHRANQRGHRGLDRGG